MEFSVSLLHSSCQGHGNGDLLHPRVHLQSPWSYNKETQTPAHHRFHTTKQTCSVSVKILCICDSTQNHTVYLCAQLKGFQHLQNIQCITFREGNLEVLHSVASSHSCLSHKVQWEKLTNHITTQPARTDAHKILVLWLQVHNLYIRTNQYTTGSQ